MPKDILDREAEFFTDETYTEARKFVETVQSHARGEVSDEDLLQEYSQTLSLMYQMEQARTTTGPDVNSSFDEAHTERYDDRMEQTGDKYEDIREAVSMGTEYIMSEFDQDQVEEVTDREAAALLEP